MITLGMKTRNKSFENALNAAAAKIGKARAATISANHAGRGAAWRSAAFLWPLSERI